MPGLGGDPVEVDAGLEGGGGVAGAQGVGGDAFGGEAGVGGAGAEHPGDGVAGECAEADVGVEQPGEQRSGLVAPMGAPAGESLDRVGGGVVAVGDADDGAFGVLVGLGRAQMQQQPAGLRLDVIQSERDQLGAAQRGGVAEQNDRGVAGAERGAAVDGAQDLAQVGGGERPGLADRGDAVGAAQAAADLAHGVVVGRVGNAANAVDVPDRRASHGEGLHRGPGLGTFGEVGAQGHRVGGEGVQVTGVAPALPLAPQVGVDLAGGGGAGGGDRGADALQVGGGQAVVRPEPGRGGIEVHDRLASRPGPAPPVRRAIAGAGGDSRQGRTV